MNPSSDTLIIGGGIIGLAIAVELKRRGRSVTVLSRNFQQAASHAAAGMLAPYAEQIPAGPMLDLCLKSRWLYPHWVNQLEASVGMKVGYFPCGILAPQYELPSNIVNNSTAVWLEREAIRQQQPGLGEDVVGGWWHPEDGQVNNRRLLQALLQAAQNFGVNLREGVAVHQWEQQQGKIQRVLTNEGDWQAQTYVLATGSWASELLPIPVRPVKGQMMALQMPYQPNDPLPLQRILFAPSTYLVPRRNGRLIVGATAEEVGWLPNNTPKGIQTLLQRASRLYPPLLDWPIEEIWWGFRPGTPDELPILGRGQCDNLILATGHYRNGILLAPVTASLIADLIVDNKIDPLLNAFSGDRFLQSPHKNYSNISDPRITTMTTNGHSGHSSNGHRASNQNGHSSNGSNPLAFAFSQLKDLPAPKTSTPQADSITIAGRDFSSRLMTGTGKYPSMEVMQQSVAASGCEMVTVAVRRVQNNAPGHEGLAEALDWTKVWMLPNTAGCKTAEEAVRVARLGREMAKLLGQEDNNFVKLEVIPDAKYLLPDPIGTLQAAEKLVTEGFAVLPYINADPLLAKRLEEVGCATVMPLGSPIGSGQGIRNAANIAIIIEESTIPVVVDAGIGTPSEAAQAMEMGADALLINSAIALAKNPVAMAQAMGLATTAGRLAYLAGRMPLKSQASASSPLTGTIK